MIAPRGPRRPASCENGATVCGALAAVAREDSVDEGTGEAGAARQLDASEVNRLAQEIDEAALNQSTPGWTGESIPSGGDLSEGGTEAGSVSGAPSAETATAGEDSLEAEERERRAHLFPDDVVPRVEIGGSPEEQGVLRDEYNEG